MHAYAFPFKVEEFLLNALLQVLYTSLMIILGLLRLRSCISEQAKWYLWLHPCMSTVTKIRILHAKSLIGSAKPDRAVCGSRIYIY